MTSEMAYRPLRPASLVVQRRRAGRRIVHVLEQHTVAAQQLARPADRLPLREVVVLATDDDTVPAGSIRSLPRSPVADLIELPGDHLLPVTEPDLVAALLGERLSLVLR